MTQNQEQVPAAEDSPSSTLQASLLQVVLEDLHRMVATQHAAARAHGTGGNDGLVHYTHIGQYVVRGLEHAIKAVEAAISRNGKQEAVPAVEEEESSTLPEIAGYEWRVQSGTVGTVDWPVQSEQDCRKHADKITSNGGSARLMRRPVGSWEEVTTSQDENRETVPAAEDSPSPTLPETEYLVQFEHSSRDPQLMPYEDKVEATDRIGVWLHSDMAWDRDGARRLRELAVEVGGKSVHVFSRTVTTSRTGWKAVQL